MPHSAHSREHGKVTIIGRNDDVQGKTKRGSRFLGESLRVAVVFVPTHLSVCLLMTTRTIKRRNLIFSANDQAIAS